MNIRVYGNRTDSVWCGVLKSRYVFSCLNKDVVGSVFAAATLSVLV